MIEKLLLILVIAEVVNVIHNIAKSIMDIVSTRHLTKAQLDALEGQQRAIKIQDEQLKLNKFYSEKQNEQNENIKQLAYLINGHGIRLNELEKILAKKTVTKKPRRQSNGNCL